MRIALIALVTAGALLPAACVAPSADPVLIASETAPLVTSTGVAVLQATGTSAPIIAPIEPAKSAVPSPAWIEGAVAKIRVDHGDAGGMRGCKGELTKEAREHFTKLYAEAAKCGAAKPGLRGQITFHSTLEDGGGLSEFSVFEDKLGAPDVVACIQNAALSLEFPKVDPKTPCVQLVHPLTFP